MEYVPGAAAHLLEALRRRYNFIVADVPCHAGPFCRELLTAAHQRVLVMAPTLPAVRDALRLLALPTAAGARAPTTLVLNRLGHARRAQARTRSRTRCACRWTSSSRTCRGRSAGGDPGRARDRRRACAGAVADLAGQIGALRRPGAAGARRPGAGGAGAPLFGRR